jgi:hypothetical protein
MRQPVRTQDKRQVLHTCRPCVCALCVRARARGTAEWRPSKTESIAAMLAPEASLAQCATSTALVHLGSPNASASCGRSGASALPPDRMYSEITRPSCCCAAANPRRHRQSCICMRRAAPGAWRGSDTRRQRRQAGGRAGGRLWRDRPWASRGTCKARLALGRSEMGLWVGRPRRKSGEVGVNHQVLLSHHSRDERRSVCAGRAKVAAEANAGMRRRRITCNSVRRRTAAVAAVSRRQTSWVPNNAPTRRDRCARKAGTLRPAPGTNLDGGTGGYPMRDRYPTSTLTHSLDSTRASQNERRSGMRRTHRTAAASCSSCTPSALQVGRMKPRARCRSAAWGVQGVRAGRGRGRAG